MKTWLVRIRAAVIMLFAVGSISFAQTTFSIIHVNDTHSHLDAFGPKDGAMEGTLGGIARAATAIGMASAGVENRVLLHAGDVMVGDPMFNQFLGIPEFTLLGQIGFDAVAMGNHELDLGPDALLYALSNSAGAPPMLTANVDPAPVPGLGTYVRPYIVKTFGDVKVGIFGLTIPNPLNNPLPLVVDQDFGTIAGTQAAYLRTVENCDVVICLSHLGIYLDRLIAAAVPGIDVIVGGHDHYLLQQPEAVTNPLDGTTWIVQAGEYYRWIGKMTLTYDAGTLTLDDYTLFTVDGSVKPVNKIRNFVQGLKTTVSKNYGTDMYHKPMTYLASFMDEHFNPAAPQRDTPAGNFVTDAYIHATDATVAITALGLIGEELYAGQINRADLFRLVPYGFNQSNGYGLNLVTSTIDGRNLIGGLEVGVSSLDMGDDFVIQTSGITFAFDPNQPVGSRVDYTSIRVNGQPIDPFGSYTLVTNRAIADLLQGYGIVVTNQQELNLSEYEALVSYAQSKKTINPQVEGRIIDLSIPVTPKTTVPLAASSLSISTSPEPFTGAAQVSFRLDKASDATIALHDVLGRRVAVVAEGSFGEGVHTATLRADGLPSGVYFCVLRAGDQVASRRVTIMR